MASNRPKRMPKANVRLASMREETDELEASARGVSARSIEKKNELEASAKGASESSVEKKKRKTPSVSDDAPSKKKTSIR